jgi:hypothetical protein
MMLSSLVEIVIDLGLIFIGDLDIRGDVVVLKCMVGYMAIKCPKLYRDTYIWVRTNARFVLIARQMQGRFVEVNRGSDG